MFDACQKSAGTGYTTTVAFLVVAFICSRAVLVASPPLGYVSLSLAIACGALCVTLAQAIWKKWPHISIPSTATQRGTAK
jgi:hypothetical protein